MNNKMTSSSKPLNRIFGYDLARTLSLMGMVVISFWSLAGDEDNAPEWLNSFVEIIMGRAAVAFVILAGVGLSLLTKSAYISKGAVIITVTRTRSVQKKLMKRAFFLFVIGMLNCLIWPWDILHFYALYFMIAAHLITTSNRKLWAVIFSALFVFSVFMLIIGYNRGQEWDSIGPEDLIYLSGVLYHLLFGGLYPIFPWLGFLFIGIWIGRLDLTNQSFRKKIMLASIAAVILSETLSLITFRIFLFEWRLMWIIRFTPWFEIDPWEPMPLFFLSGAGSAIIAISLCVILTEKFSTAKWLPPLVAVGQSSLTLYVAHTLVGTLVVMAMDQFDWDYPLFAVWGTILFFLAATLFCYKWNKRFKRGPLELLMRRFLAHPIRLTLSGVHPIDLAQSK